MGNIAWRYDSRVKEGIYGSLSHAKAYTKNPHTNIIAGCSIDKKDRTDFEDKYNVQVFETVEEMLLNIKPDIVSICSPTKYHYYHLTLCLKYNISMIWLEKPSVANYFEYKKLLKYKIKSKILVNYPRRYLTNFKLLRDEIKQRTLKGVKDIVIHYSKGLLTNGCHIIDSLFMVLGESSNQKIGSIKIINNGKNPSFLFNHQNILIYVIGHDISYHSREISVTFDNSRISINQEGDQFIYEEKIEKRYFPGFYQLAEIKHKSKKPNDYDKALDRALFNLINSYEKNTQTDSNLFTSKPTQEVIDIVKNGTL